MKKVKLKTLEAGTIFKFGDVFLIKTEKLSDETGTYPVNSVSIATGVGYYINENETVEI